MGYRPSTAVREPHHPPGWVPDEPVDGCCQGCGMDDEPLTLHQARPHWGAAWRCRWCADLAELHAEQPMPDPGIRSDGKRCKRAGCRLARKHHGRCWGADGWLPLPADDLGPR